MRLRHFPLCVFLAASLLFTAPAVAAEDAELRLLDVAVYGDGVSGVSMVYDTDPSLVQVDVWMPGFPYVDLLVSNEDGLPLDYALNGSTVTVDIIGSTEVNAVYLSSGLTSKAGSVWTLNVSSPVTVEVTLPTGSTIIGLSMLPIMIEQLEGVTVLRMLPGDISVQYITTVFDSRSSAEEAVTNATAIIQGLLDEGVKLTDAVDLLEQANSALEQQMYSDAITLAAQAQDAATQTYNEYTEAEEALTSAMEAVTLAESEGRSEGLDVAEGLLEEANALFSMGDYASARGMADQCLAAAEGSTKPERSTLTYLAVASLGLAVIVAVVRLRKGSEKHVTETPGVIDVEAIFTEFPELRMDDRELIRFLAESGGELFANEIRERFEIPRTSAWRMIRRLSGMGILEERKVGGQSLVSVSETWRRRG